MADPIATIITDFNNELKAVYTKALAIFETVDKDALLALGILETDLPKVQHVLSVAASITALIPGAGSTIGGYMLTAANAVGIADTAVKTVDGIIMSANEAAAVGAATVPATPAEKLTSVAAAIVAQHPDVPQNTADLHAVLAYASVAKLGVNPTS